MRKFLLAMLVATACISYVSATADAAWTASLSGKVVDVTTMNPVDGATIRIYAMRGSHQLGKAITDADGAFVVSGLKGGEYWLQFERRGYQRTAIGGIFVPPNQRLIEAAPMAMYPNGTPVPKVSATNPCGLIQPNETADVYIVCNGD